MGSGAAHNQLPDSRVTIGTHNQQINIVGVLVLFKYGLRVSANNGGLGFETRVRQFVLGPFQLFAITVDIGTRPGESEFP